VPDEGTLVVGSSHKHAEVCLHDISVARVHCQLQMSGGKVVVMGLEDASGTFVNGERVQERTLEPGDLVRIGHTEFRLQKEGSPDDTEVCEVVDEEGAAVVAEAVHDETVVEAVAADDDVIMEAAIVEEPEPDTPATRLKKLAGTTIGHYAVRSLLGEGPAGCVYRAEDPKAGKNVVLKVIRPSFPASKDETHRFVQAIKAVMALHHDHLVGVIGAGRTSTYAWLAQEYVEGKSLSQFLTLPGTAGMLNWRHVLRVAVHLARALDYVHGQHWLHRHLTPQDVLIRDSDKTIKLNDLVLVQALAGSALHKQILHDQPPAAWCYLAPEQTKSLGAGGVQADLYGLGAVLFTALTGKPPCLGSDLLDTITRMRQTKPARPKEFQFSSPDALENAVLHLLAKQPEGRPESAAAVLAEFTELANAEGVAV
jgi:hypothetical protein